MNYVLLEDWPVVELGEAPGIPKAELVGDDNYFRLCRLEGGPERRPITCRCFVLVRSKEITVVQVSCALSQPEIVQGIDASTKRIEALNLTIQLRSQACELKREGLFKRSVDSERMHKPCRARSQPQALKRKRDDREDSRRSQPGKSIDKVHAHYQEQ